jgi:hypothetical protein
MCRHSVEGSLALLVLCNCKHLELRGSVVISSQQPIARCEISKTAETFEVNCSDKNLRIPDEVLSSVFATRNEVIQESDRSLS